MAINRLYSKQIKSYDLREKDKMSKKEMTIGEACRTILRSGRDAILDILTFNEFTLTDDPEKLNPGVLTDKKPKRARTVKGKYKADNKKTKNVNEAWVGGKAPKKK